MKWEKFYLVIAVIFFIDVVAVMVALYRNPSVTWFMVGILSLFALVHFENLWQEERRDCS